MKSCYVSPAPGLLCLAAMFAITITGCEAPPTVDGTVTVGGLQIEEGSINFFPIEGEGASSGTAIKNGKFENLKGLSPGEYRIAIQGTRPHPVDRITLPFSEEEIPKPVQVVPAEYRKPDSPLIKTVEPGHQIFSLDLPGISEKKRSR